MIKDYITFAEMKGFVDDMVTLCIIDGEYQSYVRDFAYKYCVLKYFTDYPIANKNYEELYSDFYQNAEVKQIIDMIESNNSQLFEINRCVEETFYVIIEKEIRRNKLTDFISSLLDSLDNKETVALLASAIESRSDLNGKN